MTDFTDLTRTICGEKWDEDSRKIHLTLTIPGTPRTKKNSQRIITVKGRPMIIPSKDFKAYSAACMRHLPHTLKPRIAERVNVCCVYYMPSRRRVDLLNLLGATCDILVEGGILLDDHCGIVAAHDGSRVEYDKLNPRVEITLEAMD